MKTYKSLIRILATVVVLFLTGCATQIADIQENPQGFLRKTVRLRGIVERSLHVPLTEYTVYVLRDESERAVVFAPVSRQEDQEITLKGKVIAMPLEESQEAAQRATEDLSVFLVDSRLVEAAQAKRIASAVLKVIQATLRAAGKGFFIVEQVGE